MAVWVWTLQYLFNVQHSTFLLVSPTWAMTLYCCFWFHFSWGNFLIDLLLRVLKDFLLGQFCDWPSPFLSFCVHSSRSETQAFSYFHVVSCLNWFLVTLDSFLRVQVYILRALVRIAQDTGSLHWWWATLLVAGMLVTSSTQSITQHHCFTIGQRTGMKARASIAMAVFNKVIHVVAVHDIANIQ